MKIIDFRLRPPLLGFLKEHIYPRPGFRATLQLGFTPPPSVIERSFDLMVEEMDRAGITMGVAVGRNTRLAAVPNTDVAKIAELHPDRFVPVASINPADRLDGMRQYAEARALGIKLINLEPGSFAEPMHVDDRRLYPLYATCEDDKTPVVLMSGGAPGPDVSFTSPEHIDRVLGDFPNLTVISAHGNWPWVQEIIHVAFRRPNLYLSPDMYLYNMPGMSDYIMAANGFMGERILFGTAYPICPLEEYTKWFLTLPIRPERMEDILYNNAARVLGL